MSKQPVLCIMFRAIGDIICCTPLIPILSKAYNKKIDIVTYCPEIFKNNPLVDKVTRQKNYHAVKDHIYTLDLGKFTSNKSVIEFKHNRMDIRQYFAALLGFSLLPNEMTCLYYPDDYIPIKDLPTRYIVVHPTQTWPSRTWSKQKWQHLIDSINIPVVAIAKDSAELGFFNTQKPSFDINIADGLNLINKTSLSQAWHVINKADMIITMDSGMLHLAGTTASHIIQLGSSINPLFRAPYRKGSQDYKYDYVGGKCVSYCASDMMYGVMEHGTIQGIPPLVNCLEHRKNFDCHPVPKDVLKVVESLNKKHPLHDMLDNMKDLSPEFSKTVDENFWDLIDDKDYANEKIPYHKDLNKEKMNKKKIMFITPHLSTGGLPAVLLKRIQYLKDDYDIGIIEWCNYSTAYIVQKNQIKDLVSYYKTLGGSKETVLKYINKFKPDIIHFEEMPEHSVWHEVDHSFDSTHKTMKMIHDNFSGPIIHTSHCNHRTFKDKIYKPIKYFLVGDYHTDLYKDILNNDYEVIEHPIELYDSDIPENPFTEESVINKYNILMIGLWHENKNQGYCIELAKILGPEYHFHFVGNTASNFQEYWQPLINDMPKNCHIYGERDDIDKFLYHCDALILPSKNEFNPVIFYEALNYKKPILAFPLEAYNHTTTGQHILHLADNIAKDVELIKDVMENKPIMLVKDTSEEYKNRISMFYKSLDITEFKELDIPYIDTSDIKVLFNFVDGAKCEILGSGDDLYDIVFIDNNNNKIEYASKIKPNHWSSANKKYFVDWHITVSKDGKLIKEHNINPEGKRVFIAFESKSLGDTLAWIPYVEEFRTKHKCDIICSTFWNSFFTDVYPDIEFVNPGSVVPNLYAMYKLGIFSVNDKRPQDTKAIPLQKVASDILGLDYREIRPRITNLKHNTWMDKQSSKKQVCIAIHGTAQSKYWNNKDGWQEVVDYLKSKGYEVLLISKEHDGYMTNKHPKGVIDKTGNIPIEQRIQDIIDSEFFIGISSGLSWLAWATTTPVIMISGHTMPYYEFDCERVHNNTVCNGCWHNSEFDKGYWKWCPNNKDFECTKSITSDMVIKAIDNIRSKSFNINEQKAWNDNSIWTDDGNEWSTKFKDTKTLWSKFIQPRIDKFIHGVVLEIAPGHGRITQYLHNKCDKLHIVDMNECCITCCMDKFKDVNNIQYHINDGQSLDMIQDNSIDFMISWDSFVHMNQQVIESYIKQISLKLKASSYGIIHHSNLINGSESVFNNIGGRSNMTADTFKNICEKNDLYVVSQELKQIGTIKGLKDCITIFKKKGLVLPYYKYQDVDYDDIFNNKVYEHGECYIKEGDIVVDVGANIGVFTQYAEHKKAKKVYAFEPDKENYRCLLKNMSTITEPYNIAITSKDGDVMLNIDSFSGGHTIYGYDNNNSKTGKKIEVPCRSIMSLLEDKTIPNIDFLKIDAEGSEYDIFNNLTTDILKNIRCIAMEYHHMVLFGITTVDDLINKLSKYFHCYRLDYTGGHLSMLYFWKK